MLRAEIVDEHDVDEGLVEQADDHGAAVRGDAECGCAVVRLLMIHGHRQRACLGCERVKVESGLAGDGRVGVIDSVRGDREVSPTSHRRVIEKFCLFATVHGPTVNGHTPKSWNIAALRIIEEFSVERRNRGEASVVSNLGGGSSFGSDFPDLPGAAAIGRKIEPLAIYRPTCDTVFRITLSDLARLAD